jgi:hypothetical protein
MQQLERLICTPQQSLDLRSLGVITQPVLYWHTLEEVASSVDPVWRPGAMPFATVEDADDDMIPAYTKAELDVMIGPGFPKPDLWTDKEFLNSEKNIPVSEDTEQEYARKRATNRFTFPVFYPDRMKVYKVGAQASAEVLAFLVRNNHIKPADAIARHKKVFLP